MKHILAVLAGSLLALSSSSAAEAGPEWMRYPAIAPDGGSIVFGYRGNLYRVDSAGGIAAPLTLHEGHDFMPVWSPDGTSIAFASDRFGNFDVYVLPAQGGQARRLTFHSADDFPTDFTPDGKNVLFGSTRTDAASSAQFPSGGLPELFQVGIPADPGQEPGRPRQISTLPADAARFDKGGQRLVYQDRKGYESAWRKHHRSSVTRDVWILDLRDGSHSRITDFAGEDRNPVFSADEQSVYYLSEAGGTFNVFRTGVDGRGTPAQLTRFEHHPVRFLTRAADDTLCFGYHGQIYTLRPGGEPRRVEIEILAAADDRGEQVLPITSGVSEFVLSPNGKELAFVVRGEIFATSIESDVTKRITDTPEQERSIDFSPDGRSLVYAAERDGSWNIYRSSLVRKEESYFFNGTLIEETPVLVTDAETFQPAFSPDGKEVAYLENSTELKVLNLDSGQTRTILAADRNFSYADGDQRYQWSPDGKWFLTGFQQPNYWISEVGLIASSGAGEIFNLTESGYFDSSPAWMMKGKMMLWVSNRDGLQGHAKTGPAEGDAYGLFFTQEAFDRFKLTKEEYDLLKEKEEEEEEEGGESDDGDGDAAEKKKKKQDKKDKKDKKGDSKKDAELPEVKIELDGIRDRKARLTIHSSRLADAVVTPDGEKLLYLARFEKGHDLWVTELRTRETKILAKLGASGGALALDKEGKHVFVLAGGKLSRLEVDSGDRKAVEIAGEMTLDTAAERAYFFEHAWRQVKRKFYDPGLHGADWDFLRGEYARFLPDINNNYDFAEMLSELLGELNASHTGARYRHSAENGDATASLGLLYDESHTGPGLKIAEVIAHNPMVGAASRLAAGVIIEKIDGAPIMEDTNFHRLLNRKADKYVLLSLFDPTPEPRGTGAAAPARWDEIVKPLSLDTEAQLLYRRWVENRRRVTDELSGGRVGYVHVRGMNDPSYRTVLEEVLGKLANKEALVVDTRFNGGGDLVDDLSIFLSGTKYMDFIPPAGLSIGMEPSRRWTKPSIVIGSEGNYSDAHCFPWAYQELKIGKLVGTPIPGTCTFVWWETLQDRSLVFGIPNMGIKDKAGRYLENLQIEPEIRVDNEPRALAAGTDQQLERAVAELLEQLNGG